jgi:hypothetical protein
MVNKGVFAKKNFFFCCCKDNKLVLYFEFYSQLENFDLAYVFENEKDFG